MIGLLHTDVATLADEPAIAGLEVSDSTRRSLGTMLERDDHRCLVARLDGEVVGVAVGLLQHDEAHVVDVAVASAVRRQGVAAQLLADLEDRLAADGAVATTLEVRPSNVAARGLYHRLGYVEEGRRRRYYPDGEDAIILWRRASRDGGEARP